MNRNEKYIKVFKQLLSLTPEQKDNGVYYDPVNMELYYWGDEPDDFTGEYKEWYDDNVLYVHKHYKNGKLHGVCKWWHGNGVLYAYRHYKNGKMIKDYLEEG